MSDTNESTPNTLPESANEADTTRRIPITDGDGNWFDPDKATHWEEGTRWDGNNYISLATNIQWNHEKLYRTANGAWVLHSWSNYQGRGESYVCIKESEAASWLIRSEHELPEELAEIGKNLEI